MLIQIDIENILQGIADETVKEYNDPMSWDDPSEKIADADTFPVSYLLESVVDYTRNYGDLTVATEDIYANYYTGDEPEEECMINFAEHFLNDVLCTLEGINVKSFDFKLEEKNIFIDTSKEIIDVSERVVG